MTRLLLAAAFAGAMLGCVHHLECPADQTAQGKVAAELVRRFSCQHGDAVAATMGGLSDWRCKSRDELGAAVVPDGASHAKGDCLILSGKVRVYLEEGTPSEWGCAGVGRLDDTLEKVCEAL